MLVVIIILLVVLASAIIGFWAARLGAKYIPIIDFDPFRKFAVTPGSGLSTFSRVTRLAILAGVTAYYLLTDVVLFVPVSDDPIFQKTDNLTISKETESKSKDASCHLCASEEIIIFSKFSIAYPSTVQVHRDFRVNVEFYSVLSSSVNDIYSAALFIPKHIEGRTTEACKDEKGVAIRACSDATSSTLPVRVRLSWELTPTKTGRPLIAITSDLIRSSKNTSELETVIRVVQGDVYQEKVVKVTEGVTTIGNIIVDFTNREISFPIEVLTTLGVSQSVYDWVKVASGVIAALGTMLGAGFALKFFTAKESTSDLKLPAPNRKKHR